MDIVLEHIGEAIELLMEYSDPQIKETYDAIMVLSPFLTYITALELTLLLSLVLLTLRDIIFLIITLRINHRLAQRKVMKEVMNPGHEKKILIAGDSTAVGTGADSVEGTLMGMLARDFPQTEIHNVSKNGAVTSDVIAQLKSVEGKHFAFALISTGGNDVWHFNWFSLIAKDLRTIIKMTSAMTDNHVVLLLQSFESSASRFPFFIRKFLIRRSNKMNDMLRKIAKEERIHYVDIFTEKNRNPFIDHPEQFFAKDGIHPSSKGYHLWYNRLWRVMVEQGYGVRR